MKKEETKEVKKIRPVMKLNDNELEQVTGGFGRRRSFCGCFVPMPDGNGYCAQCGCEILK